MLAKRSQEKPIHAPTSWVGAVIRDRGPAKDGASKPRLNEGVVGASAASRMPTLATAPPTVPVAARTVVNQAPGPSLTNS